MKARKLLVGAAVSAALGLGAVGAQAATINSMTINSFGFAMNHTNSYESGTDDNSANLINLPITMGTLQGGFGGATTADKAAGIVGFDFSYFGPVASYTTGPNAAPSGDVTGTTVTLDLESWTAYWNGTEFNQGGSTAGNMTISNFVDNGDGTYDFDAVWTKLISGGPPFGGQTGHWGLSLTADTNANVVPIPAAAWLFGSGLLGLIGIARRKTA